MIIKATFFGKTKLVRATPHNMEENEDHDCVLWVERGEDYYALSSMKNKKVAIVSRHDWIKSKEITL